MLSLDLEKTLKKAYQLATNKKHEYVTLEHLLFSLTEDKDALSVLKACEVNIILLRKKLEEAMSVVDKFGTDARSITRTLESIKDPEQLEKAVQTENVEKFVDHSKQANK